MQGVEIDTKEDNFTCLHGYLNEALNSSSFIKLSDGFKAI